MSSYNPQSPLGNNENPQQEGSVVASGGAQGHAREAIPNNGDGTVSYVDNSAYHKAESESNSSGSKDITGNQKEAVLGAENATGAELDEAYTHSVADYGPSNSSTPEETQRLPRALTGSHRSNSAAPLPAMGGGRPYPPKLPDKDQYVVSFEDADDPLHPFNWSTKKKTSTFICLTVLVFSVTFGSSVFSAATSDLVKQFHVSAEIITLGISLYVLGFATGPIVWAPLSELYGRKPILVLSALVFTCFLFAVATAKDLQTIMICRFFGGAFGSAPLVVVSAAFADMYDNKTRGYAIAIFCLCVVLGPQFAPIVGGFVSASYLGWRWTEYLTGILAGLSFTLCVLFYEESHHPTLLASKAEQLRRRTGIWGIRAAQEEMHLSFEEIVHTTISRPLKLLFTEPIIFLITLYTSFVYGILYLCLEAYPIIFAEGYKWKGGVVFLPYISLVVGQVLACVWVIYCEKFNIRAVDRNEGKPSPESRLPPMMPGAIAFPIGLLWLCWTGNYHDTVPWPAPACAGIFIGFGIMSIFLPSLNYIIDSYLIYTASAMAANTLVRSTFGAVFPLFATYMFHGMGTNWAGLLLGLFALVLAPVPWLFYKFGKRIRSKSKYAFDLQ